MSEPARSTNAPALAGRISSATGIEDPLTGTTVDDPPEEMPKHPLGTLGTTVLAVYLFVVAGLCVWGLLAMWPSEAPRVQAAPSSGSPAVSRSADTPATGRPATGDSALQVTLPLTATREGGCAGGSCPDSVKLFGRTIDFGGRRFGHRFLWIALFAGGLGAFASTILSLASFRGNGKLDLAWSLWYIARPPVGMVLGLLSYLLLRAGILTPNPDAAAAVNPYGVAAVAALLGMFVKESMDKFRDVATTVFNSKEDEKRSMKLSSHAKPEDMTANKTPTAAANAAAATGATAATEQATDA